LQVKSAKLYPVSLKQISLKYLLKLALRWLLIVIGIGIFTSFFYTLYLRWFPPFTTSLIIQRRYNTGYNADSTRPQIHAKWKSYSKISDHIKLAVIASEDQAFASHNGFDFSAMNSALKSNLKRKSKLKGGSTISQQVAKNVFLWQQRSYLRKGVEAYYTFLIEMLWPKTRILEMYLNVAEWGDGIFGIEAAARHYYHKSANDLTKREAAALAAILPSPRRWNPKSKKGLVVVRTQRNLRAMKKIGGKGYLKSLE